MLLLSTLHKLIIVITIIIMKLNFKLYPERKRPDSNDFLNENVL